MAICRKSLWIYGWRSAWPGGAGGREKEGESASVCLIHDERAASFVFVRRKSLHINGREENPFDFHGRENDNEGTRCGNYTHTRKGERDLPLSVGRVTICLEESGSMLRDVKSIV